MSYLRTNYRATGGQVDDLAIGPAIRQGSNAGGSGVTKPFGGLVLATMYTTVLASEASTTAGATGYACVSMVSLLASAWGCDSPLLNSGYLIKPLWVNIIWASNGLSDGDSQRGWAGQEMYWWRDAQVSGSLIMMRYYQLSSKTDSGATSVLPASVPALCSDDSEFKILFAGFIVSGPGAGW